MCVYNLQVMAELNCSSLYAIVPYDKYKALQRAAASSSAAVLVPSRHGGQQRNLLSTGITPTMEKCSTAAFLSPPFSMVTPDSNGKKKNKKRSISPSDDERGELGLVAATAATDTAGGAGQNVYKRSKSVTEDGTPVITKKPVFEENDNWG